MTSVGGGATALGGNIDTNLSTSTIDLFTEGNENEENSADENNWLELPEVFDQYQAIYQPHQEDEFWVEKLYTEISGFSDEKLLEQYDIYYANATEGEDVLQYVDTLAVTESVFIDRGFEIPEGNEYSNTLWENLIDEGTAQVAEETYEYEEK